MGRLTGKTALITGGTGGLGMAAAMGFAAEGAQVAISDLETSNGAEIAEREGFLFLGQDVRDEARWDAVVAATEVRFGRLDILLNSAGIVGPLDQVNPENTRFADWQRVFSINVDGVFLGCRAALPALRRAGGGSIINMSSVAGLLATPYATAYGASKAAVTQLTKSVAQHCAHEGLAIRCNSVHPGNVRSPLWDSNAVAIAEARGVEPAQVLREAAAGVPMGDMTLPEDVVGALLFLASDDSRHVTGIELAVDGGIVHCSTYHNRTGARMLVQQQA